ncbi:recombination protein NinG [Pseudomonas botevensis]|uniref:recombination protein NinG n=1 Tax=Pseudomonas botevensis TaxID=2842352 RepID=UPI001C3E7BE1|nr:recombination protein NinG [Pseudomonas botevensis]MBV4477607.1 recombination protein NinG [Pseudomonas botevensis]
MRTAIKEKKAPKPKKCRVVSCGASFVPARLGQAVCSPACALKDAPRNEQKAKRAIDQRNRREIEVRKEKLKTRTDHLKDAEKAVRDYRRMYELSIGSGCISCGESQESILAAQGWKTGGAFDAGHFLGKGARPELRLVPNNIWLQCKSCNAGSSKYARKGQTVSQSFRTGLIARIGLEAVEALEADHEPRKHTVEELKAITAEFRAKTRELKKGEAA